MTEKKEAARRKAVGCFFFLGEEYKGFKGFKKNKENKVFKGFKENKEYKGFKDLKVFKALMLLINTDDLCRNDNFRSKQSKNKLKNRFLLLYLPPD